MSETEINIEITDNGWKKNIPNVERYVKECILSILKLLEIKEPIELGIRLSSNDEIAVFNNKFRNKNFPTNVLSFNQSKNDKNLFYKDSERKLMGDIIVAYGVIENEAIEQQKQLKYHFLHMIIHGFLHLLGYDHISVEDSEKMEKIEIELLANFGVSNPYKIM
ncbi:rRNA maturation RNase YbeY [Alphaproteobacteria bacterium]|nr:rRNA maturation RNase YbeY [Alphaproteobacteria bacterium]